MWESFSKSAFLGGEWENSFRNGKYAQLPGRIRQAVLEKTQR